MNWKSLLTTISLSSLILCACGTDDDTAMNNTGEINQDAANLRTVSDNQTNENQTRRTTINNVNNNQNRDITARNIANNTADNDQNGNMVNNRNNHIEVADRAAEKIAQMREVDRANVIVTDNNAYVAAKLADNADNGLTSYVEKRISDMVKAAYPEIEHVYVSVNPDFYKRTTSYAEDIRNGRPVAGFFDEFSELVRRVFPTER
ncbi:YhcN/YlaJ family sporulation lipoprotein [Niallia endozanthoxylica]|uniref:YhcN/YlaJ family sporulation lipoprotein n=1 Tax=Niallia endozanthoxylica TaxID=2036016 RepID=A0A5J5HT94_9BACI|nr:YhcN/YlaJ family sporulation lipoprotein [Niallia endozanthoxylica]KAA9025746.1 YhcN/YlaJ family sporulation lipoprotein [Niallia endozanthoxylica]